MASKDILSQEEIDALLHSVDNGEVGPSSQKYKSNPDAKPYDITSREKIVSGRIPKLEMINDRFVRDFRISLLNTIRRAVDVRLESISMMKYSEYIKTVETPASLSVIRAEPLKGTGLVQIEPKLILTIIDSLFGGSGRRYRKGEKKDLTTTELRVIKMISDVFFQDYKIAWDPVIELNMEYINHETNPSIVQVVSGSEIVIVNHLYIEMDNGGGSFKIILPYTMIEPIRSLLDKNMEDNKSYSDQRWEILLKEEIKSVEVDMNCILTEIDMSVRELSHLKEGDIIPIDKPEKIISSIQNIPLIFGTFGESNGKSAFKIERFMKIDEDIIEAQLNNIISANKNRSFKNLS